MAILRNKEIRNMTLNDREKKLKELKMELVKSRGNSSKSGNNKIAEIKKTIARMITLNKSKKTEEKSSKKDELNKK